MISQAALQVFFAPLRLQREVILEQAKVSRKGAKEENDL
jgi:hypothetical protein